jgi:2,3-bisphosphoglycerate-independent phosphoglycerate mutase
MGIPKPFLLMILDGWGVCERTEGNAIAQAKTPIMDGLCKNFPCATIKASGLAVGLPEGQMGNSEVGHLNIGAGRIVYQDLTRISLAIEDGSFFNNNVLLSAMENAIKNNSSLHLMGLVSDGGVHSHNTHLYALLELAKKKGLKNVFIHAFLDGRDAPPKSALKYLAELEDRIQQIGIGKIATVSGRYYAMDRDKRWERTKLAYNAIVFRTGNFAKSALAAVESSYKEDVDDEFILPTVIELPDESNEKASVKSDDSVIFFNFRSDRPRQLTESLTGKNFSGFERGENLSFPFFVCMTEYDERFKLPLAFPPIEIKNTLADVLSQNGLKQLHIAETEKYAHVTFFFNGGVEEPKKNEDRVLVPSPKVATYDLKPEMSAYEVTEKVVEAIKSKKYDFIVLNYANSDMVGHTGIMDAAEKAVEAADSCIGKVINALEEVGGVCLTLADHGNAEQMIDYKTSKPHTAHTSNPTPLIYFSDAAVLLRKDGILADVAPTILEIIKIKKPAEMTGKSLLER